LPLDASYRLFTETNAERINLGFNRAADFKR